MILGVRLAYDLIDYDNIWINNYVSADVSSFESANLTPFLDPQISIVIKDWSGWDQSGFTKK